MALLPLSYAPNPIFKKKALTVTDFNDDLRALVADMFNTLEHERGVGMGANMVGVLKRIAIVDLRPDGVSTPFSFINPEIIWQSDEQQTNEEASLCFPGIDANITRSHAVEVTYQNLDGEAQSLKAEGFLACVIQHEIDYLNGVTFLDHLSKTKRDMLLKKMQKHIKANPLAEQNSACVRPCCG